MEDAVVPSRCVRANGIDTSTALPRHKACRTQRTSAMQVDSHTNDWLRESVDPTLAHGSEAPSAPLDEDREGVGTWEVQR